MTTLVAAPTAFYSDDTGRLLASVPGKQGGLFVVDPRRGETRRFISGDVTSVSGSRDGKLFVASALLDEQYFALRMEADQKTLLFDIFDDPGCKQDLSGDRPELVERAQTLFTSQHTENPWYVELTETLRTTAPGGPARRSAPSPRG